jgi:hypothetical protein
LILGLDCSTNLKPIIIDWGKRLLSSNIMIRISSFKFMRKKIKVKLYEGEKGSEIILAHIFSLVRVVDSLHQELRGVKRVP